MFARVRKEVVARVDLMLDGRHWRVRFVDDEPNRVTVVLDGGEQRTYWHHAHRKIGNPSSITHRVISAARQHLNDHA